MQAICYLDAGQAALRTDHNNHPNVHCPITMLHYDAHSEYNGADGSCTLVMSTNLAARYYLDPGH